LTTRIDPFSNPRATISTTGLYSMHVILGRVPFPADLIIYLKSNIISPLIIFHNYKQPDSSLS
jgi:hypothetical protein